MTVGETFAKMIRGEEVDVEELKYALHAAMQYCHTAMLASLLTDPKGTAVRAFGILLMSDRDKALQNKPEIVPGTPEFRARAEECVAEAEQLFKQINEEEEKRQKSRFN